MTEELIINVPSSWNEITLGMFQEMSGLDPALDGLERLIEVFAIITDKDPADVAALPITSIKRIAELMQWTAETPMPDFQRSVIINDEIYAIVPRLDELTVGEWIDMENYAADLMNNLHFFLAILYRPVVSKTATGFRVAEYDSKEMLERAEVFKQHMKIGEVYGASLFFSLIAMRLLKSSVASLAEQLNQPMTT